MLKESQLLSSAAVHCLRLFAGPTSFLLSPTERTTSLKSTTSTFKQRWWHWFSHSYDDIYSFHFTSLQFLSLGCFDHIGPCMYNYSIKSVNVQFIRNVVKPSSMCVRHQTVLDSCRVSQTAACTAQIYVSTRHLQLWSDRYFECSALMIKQVTLSNEQEEAVTLYYIGLLCRGHSKVSAMWLIWANQNTNPSCFRRSTASPRTSLRSRYVLCKWIELLRKIILTANCRSSIPRLTEEAATCTQTTR